MNEEIKLSGNLALVGFEILEPIELDSINKIVTNYIKKLSENRDFKELRLTLRQHSHGKSFKHEIEGFALIGKSRLTAEVTEWNLYKAISEVCEKICSEAVHSLKKEQRHDKKTFK
jgi:ribosome-associated translation inhibitor RaiA